MVKYIWCSKNAQILKYHYFATASHARLSLKCSEINWKHEKGQFKCFADNNNNNRTFYGPLSGTTRVSRYQKKHSPTHQPDHHPVFISFFHLLRSIASSLFRLRAWQSFCTTSFHVIFGLPLGLEPSTSYSIHLFTQSVSFSQYMPYHRNLFCCSRSYQDYIIILFLVFLSTPYLELYLLPWHYTSICPFSSLLA